MSKENLQSISNLTSKNDSENQVIIHCSYTCFPQGSAIRIEPATRLVVGEMKVAELIMMENLASFPKYQLFGPKDKVEFTLIFSGLQRQQKSFDLELKVALFPLKSIIEKTDSGLSFELDQDNGIGEITISDIMRNENDVYSITIL